MTIQELLQRFQDTPESESRAFVDERADTGKSLIEHAVQNGNEVLFAQLMAAGAAIPPRTLIDVFDGDQFYGALIQEVIEAAPLQLHEADARGWTPLMHICDRLGGYDDGAKTLVPVAIAKGADVNHRAHDGTTPLMLMAWWPDATVEGVNPVDSLISAGARVNEADALGKTALMVAIDRSIIENVKSLLAAGADPNAAMLDGTTALMRAILSNHRDDQAACIDQMLRHGADINAVSQRGDTPLLLAAAIGDEALVLVDAEGRNPRELITHFTEQRLKRPNPARADGMTAEMLARIHKNTRVLEALAAQGLQDGTAALLDAVRGRDVQMANMFLEADVAPGRVAGAKLIQAAAGNAVMEELLHRHGVGHMRMTDAIRAQQRARAAMEQLEIFMGDGPRFPIRYPVITRPGNQTHDMRALHALAPMEGVRVDPRTDEPIAFCEPNTRVMAVMEAFRDAHARNPDMRAALTRARQVATEQVAQSRALPGEQKDHFLEGLPGQLDAELARVAAAAAVTVAAPAVAVADASPRRSLAGPRVADAGRAPPPPGGVELSRQPAPAL